MNALLKTLEEPTPRVILLLTADSPENLLPTIVSRCEVMRLRPLSHKQVETALRGRYELSERESEIYAHISGGRPGLAIRLANDSSLLDERNEWLNELIHLMASNIRLRFEFAEPLARDKDGKEREKWRARLEVWLSFWRDVVLRASGAAASISNLAWEAAIDQCAQELGLQPSAKMVGLIERSVGLMERNVNARLVVEVLMLDLPQIPLQAAQA
jgi:DNA polymerase-3 subunit delta'